MDTDTLTLAFGSLAATMRKLYLLVTASAGTTNTFSHHHFSLPLWPLQQVTEKTPDQARCQENGNKLRVPVERPVSG